MWLKRILHDFFWRVRGIRVTALVGPSGSGKSFRAQLISTRHSMDLIIDDGLLIQGQKILGGHSAKAHNNALTAIKVAAFHNNRSAQSAREQISAIQPRRILILGTSDKLVNMISRRLNLPMPHRYIRIEDIASRAEIDAAHSARESEGKHIIPVPQVEVRRDYAHMAVDAVRIFWQRGVLRKKGIVFEKTEILGQGRGAVSVSERALSQMVSHCLDEYDPQVELTRLIVIKSTGSWALEVLVNVPAGIAMGTSLHELREIIMSSLQLYTGLILSKVDITIGDVLRDYRDEKPG